MRSGWKARPFWPLVITLWIAGAHGAEEFSFDASAFEKKRFELGGYAQLKHDDFALNRGGAFYRLGYYGLPQREDLGRTTGTLELAGKVRQGIATFDFRTHSEIQRDQTVRDHNNVFYEAALSLRPDPSMTLDIGKKALKWGKGYAWNPIGFVERPKDTNDPELAREGFVIAAADLIYNREGPLQTIALTPVLLPVGNDVNSDFGVSGHVNPAAKLYLLYRDTDIDIAWQGQGSRAARFGVDFSRNLSSNLEIHGEWARINQFNRQVVSATGTVTTQRADANSYLLGMRYLTESDTTYIAEYYRNGTGYSAQESRQFYQFVDTALSQAQQTGSNALVQKAQSLVRGSYGRPNAGSNYLYFRASQKDAFGILYFQPSITAMMNWNDRSYQVTPEIVYTGVTNLELRMRAMLLQGGSQTDFGEKQNSRRLEIYARYYF